MAANEKESDSKADSKDEEGQSAGGQSYIVRIETSHHDDISGLTFFQ